MEVNDKYSAMILPVSFYSRCSNYFWAAGGTGGQLLESGCFYSRCSNHFNQKEAQVSSCGCFDLDLKFAEKS